jgi:hypothetical protein
MKMLITQIVLYWFSLQVLGTVPSLSVQIPKIQFVTPFICSLGQPDPNAAGLLVLTILRGFQDLVRGLEATNHLTNSETGLKHGAQ